jgi:2-polyprenyl-6-methoxyphenol hydroxylase-like FAD-dependent oxidoreductase
LFVDLGQGGAQAIEDALSLGVFLSAGTKGSEVPERLALYEQARKERAERIQQATRTSGLDRSVLANSDFDFEAAREYQFRHDEVLHSREILRKTCFS